MAPTKAQATVAGIDVGGTKKGFHAVAVRAGKYYCRFTSTRPVEVLSWCRAEMGATLVAVDAPCAWSVHGRSRPAEQQLMREGIGCFSTPTEILAAGHPSNHYGWMRNGMDLYRVLRDEYPLSSGMPFSGKRACFETFPHATACARLGTSISAKNKRRDRRAVLVASGIAVEELTNIDFVDAALCALAAQWASAGKACTAYGETTTGFIIAPKFR